MIFEAKAGVAAGNCGVVPWEDKFNSHIGRADLQQGVNAWLRWLARSLSADARPLTGSAERPLSARQSFARQAAPKFNSVIAPADASLRRLEQSSIQT
jgi:hypothetical protein